MSESEKEGPDSSASVVSLPVAPMNGYEAVTVRVPVKLVEALRRMKPNVEFALAVTLLVDEALTWAQQQQAFCFAQQENALLKKKLGELVLERWHAEALQRGEPE